MSQRGDPQDDRHMRHALVLAGRALGTTAPNPSVGCVVVAAAGVVVGRGWTARGGRPHAETTALAQAGEAARGATAYVTLEPCAHHGVTPPCAEALIAAGIGRVVVAVGDPDPRVNGKGVDGLRAAGVEVVMGVCAGEAADLNAGFFLCVRKSRPLVTLKVAQSSDGKTTVVSGSKWITGEQARRFGHLLRARHDAILVGIDTALVDDPELTCRLPGLEDRSPLRVVLDTRLRLGERSKLVRSAQRTPTLVYTAADGGEALKARGVEIARVALDGSGRPGIGAVLADLAGRGVTRLLVEGGAKVHAAFLDGDFADRLEVFTAPLILGAGSRNTVDGLEALISGEAPRFRAAAPRSFGPDLLVSYTRRD